ncbi:MAG TPA: SAM-dependent methyltransferase [Candidatus Paceibacterota bacterium]
MMSNKIIPGSFRDPAGFLFLKDKILYRQINIAYKENYDYFINSGLYKALREKELLIPHEETTTQKQYSPNGYKIIKPEVIPFISYPYEWCFSQYRDAALLTLAIQKKALECGMSLKDASAYNVQFKNGKPVWIDTLSFEKYPEDRPWVAYRQFCQHFLSPLTLMSFKDVRLSQLMKIFIDGIPLDLTSRLLPFHTYVRGSLLSHIHLHARSQKYFANQSARAHHAKISHFALRALIDNLESAIKNLKWNPQDTPWANYYQDTNYSSVASIHKEEVANSFLTILKPNIVWDLGANTGRYDRMKGSRSAQTIAYDNDPLAVERNYLNCKRENEKNILPLYMDITNPSAPLGWENNERMSLLERGPADTVLALALIHHVAISHNIPLEKIAHFFAKLCKSLIIEFVPKSDSNVQKLFFTREDIFPQYTQHFFEIAFQQYFKISHVEKIRESERVLYCMERI